MTEKRRILLRIDGCPFCKNAEEALDKAGIAYEKHNVDRRDRSLVRLLSGQDTVPVLVDVLGCKNQDDDIIAAIKAGELKN